MGFLVGGACAPGDLYNGKVSVNRLSGTTFNLTLQITFTLHSTFKHIGPKLMTMATVHSRAGDL